MPAQGSVTNTTGYVNYVYNISSRGTAQVASQLLGLSGIAGNILGQIAFQTSSYLNSTEGALLSLGVVASAGLTKATQFAMKFNQEMETVHAISGKTVTSLASDAMEMSNKFGVALDDMTKGLESLARAGVSTGNMTAILEQAMGLSKLEGLTLEQSINDLISTTNLLDTTNLDLNSPEYAEAVKYQAQKITATSEAAPINATNIIHTLEHVGGYASSTHIDQDDLYAVIAQLGSKGTKGDMAGTSLRAFISAGQKDTAQRALKRIGLEVSDLWKDDSTIMSISDMKDVLDEAMEARGYTQQEKLEFYSDFAGYKQANQIMKIDTTSVREFKEKIDHSWSMSKKMETVLNTAQTNLQSLMQTGINFLTKVGEPLLLIVSPIAKVIKTAIDVVDAIPFSNWVVAGGLLLVSIKSISTIFNKLGPQLLSHMDFSLNIKNIWSDTKKELKETYDIIQNISNNQILRKKSLEIEANRIVDDDKIEYFREVLGYDVQNTVDVSRLEKQLNNNYLDDIKSWKLEKIMSDIKEISKDKDDNKKEGQGNRERNKRKYSSNEIVNAMNGVASTIEIFTEELKKGSAEQKFKLDEQFRQNINDSTKYLKNIDTFVEKIYNIIEQRPSIDGNFFNGGGSSGGGSSGGSFGRGSSGGGPSGGSGGGSVNIDRDRTIVDDTVKYKKQRNVSFNDRYQYRVQNLTHQDEEVIKYAEKRAKQVEGRRRQRVKDHKDEIIDVQTRLPSVKYPKILDIDFANIGDVKFNFSRPDVQSLKDSVSVIVNVDNSIEGKIIGDFFERLIHDQLENKIIQGFRFKGKSIPRLVNDISSAFDIGDLRTTDDYGMYKNKRLETLVLAHIPRLARGSDDLNMYDSSGKYKPDLASFPLEGGNTNFQKLKDKVNRRKKFLSGDRALELTEDFTNNEINSIFNFLKYKLEIDPTSINSKAIGPRGGLKGTKNEKVDAVNQMLASLFDKKGIIDDTKYRELKRHIEKGMDEEELDKVLDNMDKDELFAYRNQFTPIKVDSITYQNRTKANLIADIEQQMKKRNEEAEYSPYVTFVDEYAENFKELYRSPIAWLYSYYYDNKDFSISDEERKFLEKTKTPDEIKEIEKARKAAKEAEKKRRLALIEPFNKKYGLNYGSKIQNLIALRNKLQGSGGLYNTDVKEELKAMRNMTEFVSTTKYNPETGKLKPNSHSKKDNKIGVSALSALIMHGESGTHGLHEWAGEIAENLITLLYQVKGYSPNDLPYEMRSSILKVNDSSRMFNDEEAVDEALRILHNQPFAYIGDNREYGTDSGIWADYFLLGSKKGGRRGKSRTQYDSKEYTALNNMSYGRLHSLLYPKSVVGPHSKKGIAEMRGFLIASEILNEETGEMETRVVQAFERLSTHGRNFPNTPIYPENKSVMTTKEKIAEAEKEAVDADFTVKKKQTQNIKTDIKEAKEINKKNIEEDQKQQEMIADFEYDRFRLTPGLKEANQAVREREKGRSEIGDEKGDHVHHLNGHNYDVQNRKALKNLMLLSEYAHNFFHMIYGKGQNTDDQMLELLLTYFPNDVPYFMLTHGASGLPARIKILRTSAHWGPETARKQFKWLNRGPYDVTYGNASDYNIFADMPYSAFFDSIVNVPYAERSLEEHREWYQHLYDRQLALGASNDILKATQKELEGGPERKSFSINNYHPDILRIYDLISDAQWDAYAGKTDEELRNILISRHWTEGSYGIRKSKPTFNKETMRWDGYDTLSREQILNHLRLSHAAGRSYLEKRIGKVGLYNIDDTGYNNFKIISSSLKTQISDNIKNKQVEEINEVLEQNDNIQEEIIKSLVVPIATAVRSDDQGTHKGLFTPEESAKRMKEDLTRRHKILLGALLTQYGIEPTDIFTSLTDSQKERALQKYYAQDFVDPTSYIKKYGEEAWKDKKARMSIKVEKYRADSGEKYFAQPFRRILSPADYYKRLLQDEKYQKEILGRDVSADDAGFIPELFEDQGTYGGKHYILDYDLAHYTVEDMERLVQLEDVMNYIQLLNTRLPLHTIKAAMHTKYSDHKEISVMPHMTDSNVLNEILNGDQNPLRTLRSFAVKNPMKIPLMAHTIEQELKRNIEQYEYFVNEHGDLSSLLFSFVAEKDFRMPTEIKHHTDADIVNKMREYEDNDNVSVVDKKGEMSLPIDFGYNVEDYDKNIGLTTPLWQLIKEPDAFLSQLSEINRILQDTDNRLTNFVHLFTNITVLMNMLEDLGSVRFTNILEMPVYQQMINKKYEDGATLLNDLLSFLTTDLKKITQGFQEVVPKTIQDERSGKNTHWNKSTWDKNSMHEDDLNLKEYKRKKNVHTGPVNKLTPLEEKNREALIKLFGGFGRYVGYHTVGEHSVQFGKNKDFSDDLIYTTIHNDGSSRFDKKGLRIITGPDDHPLYQKHLERLHKQRSVTLIEWDYQPNALLDDDYIDDFLVGEEKQTKKLDVFHDDVIQVSPNIVGPYTKLSGEMKGSIGPQIKVVPRPRIGGRGGNIPKNFNKKPKPPETKSGLSDVEEQAFLTGVALLNPEYKDFIVSQRLDQHKRKMVQQIEKGVYSTKEMEKFVTSIGDARTGRKYTQKELIRSIEFGELDDQISDFFDFRADLQDRVITERSRGVFLSDLEDWKKLDLTKFRKHFGQDLQGKEKARFQRMTRRNGPGQLLLTDEHKKFIKEELGYQQDIPSKIITREAEVKPLLLKDINDWKDYAEKLAAYELELSRPDKADKKRRKEEKQFEHRMSKIFTTMQRMPKMVRSYDEIKPENLQKGLFRFLSDDFVIADQKTEAIGDTVTRADVNYAAKTMNFWVEKILEDHNGDTEGAAEYMLNALVHEVGHLVAQHQRRGFSKTKREQPGLYQPSNVDYKEDPGEFEAYAIQSKVMKALGYDDNWAWEKLEEYQPYLKSADTEQYVRPDVVKSASVVILKALPAIIQRFNDSLDLSKYGQDFVDALQDTFNDALLTIKNHGMGVENNVTQSRWLNDTKAQMQVRQMVEDDKKRVQERMYRPIRPFGMPGWYGGSIGDFDTNIPTRPFTGMPGYVNPSVYSEAAFRGQRQARMRESIYGPISSMVDYISNKAPKGSKEPIQSLDNLQDILEENSERLQSVGFWLEDLNTVLPVLTPAILGIQAILTGKEKIEKGIGYVQGFIGLSDQIRNATTENPFKMPWHTKKGEGITDEDNMGKLLIAASDTFSSAFAKAESFLIPLIPHIIALTTAIFLISKALDWSYQSHKRYLKTLEEEQKERRSKSKALQSTANDTRNLAERNRAPRQQAALDRNARLAQQRLDNANMSRRFNAMELSRARNDTLWGDYGISAGLGKITGSYESTAEDYDGTSKEIRKIKEATFANPFATDSMRQVSAYYDANQLAFSQLDEYKEELGELYDIETNIMKKVGPDVDARSTPEFNKALDQFVKATGITRDHAKQYLDYMQTEHNVDKATQSMQAQADTIAAQTEMKVQAIAFGGNPADVLGLNGIEAQQNAMVKAQADMIKLELSGQLWWKAVWATITAPVKLIISPIFAIANLLGAIWAFMTGNWGEAWDRAGKATSSFNVFGEAATYWGAWGETESTDFNAIGQSAIDDRNRRNYGNAVATASGSGYHNTPEVPIGHYGWGGQIFVRDNGDRSQWQHSSRTNGKPINVISQGTGAIVSLLGTIISILTAGLLIGGGAALIKRKFGGGKGGIGGSIADAIHGYDFSTIKDTTISDVLKGSKEKVGGFSLGGAWDWIKGKGGRAKSLFQDKIDSYNVLKEKAQWYSSGVDLDEGEASPLVKWMAKGYDIKQRYTNAKTDLKTQYMNPWREYINKNKDQWKDSIKNEYYATKEKAQWYSSGIDLDEDNGGASPLVKWMAKGYDIKQKYTNKATDLKYKYLSKVGLGDFSFDMLQDPDKMEEFLKGKIQNADSKSLLGYGRDKVYGAMEMLKDPEATVAWAKENLTKDNIKNEYYGLKEYAEWYRNGIDLQEGEGSPLVELMAKGLDLKDQLSDPDFIKNKFDNLKERIDNFFGEDEEGEPFTLKDKIKNVKDKIFSWLRGGEEQVEETETEEKTLKDSLTTQGVAANMEMLKTAGLLATADADIDSVQNNLGVTDAEGSILLNPNLLSQTPDVGNSTVATMFHETAHNLLGHNRNLRAATMGSDDEVEWMEKTSELEAELATHGAMKQLGIDIPDWMTERLAQMKDIQYKKAPYGGARLDLVNEATQQMVDNHGFILGSLEKTVMDNPHKWGIKESASIQNTIGQVTGKKPLHLSSNNNTLMETLSDDDEIASLDWGQSLGNASDFLSSKGGKLGKVGDVMGKIGGKGKGVGKALKGIGGKLGKTGIGKLGSKAVGKIGSKLASKGIAQIGSKVLGGALIATGIGAPLGLLLESPIGGMLIEGAMNLGGAVLGGAGKVLGGIGNAIFGKKGYNNTGGSILGGVTKSPLGLLGGAIGLGGMVAGGIGGMLGGILGMGGGVKGGGMLKNAGAGVFGIMAGALTAINGKHDKNLELSEKQNKAMNKVADKVANNNSNSNASGGNITIQNININTDDDPEAIKAMFIDLIVELQEQVNPRLVSRTTGSANTSTSDSSSQTESEQSQQQQSGSGTSNSGGQGLGGH